MRTRDSIVALGLALASAGPALAQQAPPALGTPLPFEVPQTRTFALPNGLEVTLVPYGQVPRATVQLITRVGNVDEAADQVWLTDLMADLMEEGTTSRSAAQLAAEGAGMGGAISVTVGANTTTIGGTVLSDFADRAVALVADVARNPAFPASELDRLKANQLRSLSLARSQPQQLGLERFRSVLYPNHPYGRLFPSAERVQGYTIEQIRDFYDRHVHAGRSHLYVAGRFDAAAVEAAVRRAFGDWRAGEAAAPSIPTPQSRRAIHLVDKPGAVQSTLYMGLPVMDPSHPDYAALQVANALLGGSSLSRVYANLREQKGYTYSPSSSVSARYRDAYWAQLADVTTNVTGPSIREILHEIDRLRDEPPGAEELRGIQNYLAGTFVLQNSSRTGIIGQLAFLELHGLGREWLTGYVQRIYAVTPQEVQRVVRAHLDPARMTIVVVGDRAKIEDQLKPFGEIHTASD